MLEKIHNGIIHMLCIPIYLYQIILYFGSEAIRLNGRISDYFFLKRIRMTQEEFDEFLNYKMNKPEKCPECGAFNKHNLNCTIE